MQGTPSLRQILLTKLNSLPTLETTIDFFWQGRPEIILSQLFANRVKLRYFEWDFGVIEIMARLGRWLANVQYGAVPELAVKLQPINKFFRKDNIAVR